MEQPHLLRAADRALRSCNLLHTRLQSLQHTRPINTTPSKPAYQPLSSRSYSSNAPSTYPPSNPRHTSPPPPSLGKITHRFSPRGNLLLRPTSAPFAVNDSPALLDETYTALLGPNGHLLLPSELKWLAVTHKSFDHGWQGNNDRLAFLGKRIVDVQVSLALVGMPRLRSWGEEEEGREQGPVGGLENLTVFAKGRVAERRRLAGLARERGLERVVRWKPKKADDLQGSGIDTVLAHTLYAIVGALSLQRGGETTNQLVKERILAPLGLRK
ncbi:hypothetical protein KVT40_004466 [Elsinoe batatas]|uniref:RNase III domain-containing protein n=1 Tax=Elsinoe batatas TaxID=2601811 RepID=A0A8K0L5M0_9PEZI|nr:hypothetical protein KVT40_004466 [Elsinoe batatas]